MTVLELIADIERRVPAGAPFNTRASASARIDAPAGPHVVTVAARIDDRGNRREQLKVDGTRVERGVLLRLTCAEHECPQALAVRAQWAAFHGRCPAAPPAAAPAAQPLIEDLRVVVGRHHCAARPARFECFTPCPHAAHPPMQMTKTGYDLFEDGVYLGGGVVDTPHGRRPRLPSLRAAEAFVLARHVEALAAMLPAREAR
jgi:hypothetical protein